MTSGAVLVVEDESLILLDVEQSLVEAGFEVIAVYTGDDAIAAFDRAGWSNSLGSITGRPQVELRSLNVRPKSHRRTQRSYSRNIRRSASLTRN